MTTTTTKKKKQNGGGDVCNTILNPSSRSLGRARAFPYVSGAESHVLQNGKLALTKIRVSLVFRGKRDVFHYREKWVLDH